MPTYEYECHRCGHRFELFQGIKDEPRKRCPECRGKVNRLPGAGAGLLFKGAGFYTTDYRSDSYKQAAKQDSGTAKPAKSSGTDASSPTPVKEKKTTQAKDPS